VARFVWGVVWMLAFRPSPVPAFAWRRSLLRAFGARLASSALIYPSCKVWAPWNLRMEAGSCLSHYVDCYSVSSISIGRNATVSQYTYLCTASHDYNDVAVPMPLVAAPIVVGDYAWITACAYIGPGVSVGEGSVVAARSVVVRDVEAWSIVGGHPAQLIRRRAKPQTIMARQAAS
jgi:putative colanic acid biosynthesis acetyltransferase WcaF